MAASRRRWIVASVIASGALAVASLNWAQNELNLSFHSFQDSRGVTVLSPDADFSKDFTDRTSLKLKFGVDAISAASDSCARCHPNGTTNGRFVAGASVVRKYGDTKVTTGGEFSRELFYQATTALASVSRDLNQGNTTLASGVAYSFNQPTLHPGSTTESQHSIDGYVTATQSWTRRTVTQVGYEVNQINGYQSNPFLRTTLNGIKTVGIAPDARTRQAVSARLRQALPADTFVEADFRHYRDSWDVTSNALSVGLSHHFSPALVAGASVRRYSQTGAYFYQPSYTGSPQYYTGDFRLFPFDSTMATGHVEVTPPRGFLNLPEGSRVTLQYERYHATTGFNAAVFSGGLRVPLK